MQSHPLAGALFWMTGALTSFIAMAIAGRELNDGLSVAQLLCLRSAIGLLVITLLITLHNRALFRTPTPGLHLIRNSAHFAGQYGWFVGIASIPLAEVFALEFTTPIWCLLLAPLLVGEKVTLARITSVALGFAGIMLILRPGMKVIEPAALVVLAAAVGFAIAYLTTKKMTGLPGPAGSQSPLTILFYMSLLQLLLSLYPASLDWRPIEASHWPLVVVISLTALSAHYCITRALKLADASVIAPIDFLRLPLIALLGYLLYDQQLDLWVIIGAGVMLAGNYLNIRSEQRRLRQLSRPVAQPGGTP